MIKLFQYFDNDVFIVIIDHTTFKKTFQTKIKSRRLIRLNKWSMFFFTYLSHMKIIHRFEKSHQNVDDLFRLFIYNVEIYSTIILNANEKFYVFIRNFLLIDLHFDKIYNKLKQQIKNTMKKKIDSQIVYQLYRLNINLKLFYFVNRFESNRVCISIFLHFRLFQYVHDNHVHDNFNRFLYRFKQSAYIFKLNFFFQTYINDCSVCQLSKFFKKLSYDQLYFIEIFDEFLIELFMNFIMKLFMTSNDFNCFFTITNWFFKYVKFIFDRKNWNVKKWTN